MLTEELNKHLYQKAIIKLLEIKDSDIRIMTLEQCRDAVDKGMHIGGAFSAIVPLVTLFYGGFINLDITNPTKIGQDIFVLSKGHAIGSMASIYADLGYFNRSILKNSRSIDSILNGHPGPLLPGVQISTGPLGQGLGVAQGFALIGRKCPEFDVFCMTGDGELQEGLIWESVMYAGYRNLNNLCVFVDKNEGQLDDHKHLIQPMEDLEKKFTAFGWRVINLDGRQYTQLFQALSLFKNEPRDNRPTAIICNTKKGYGGFSDALANHKIVLDDNLANQEITFQKKRREQRIIEFSDIFNQIQNPLISKQVIADAEKMNLEIIIEEKIIQINPILVSVKTKRAPVRDKQIKYNAEQLPTLDPSKEYGANSVITMAMKIFARDPKVVSIDADIASASGLEAGVGFVDRDRAFNVGIAEANMMNIGEAYAALGHNVWVSTFCPFFDWKVFRRIAVGYQERMRVITSKKGWLAEGHNLDLTFVATASNFDTVTNGATHMGNDDMHVYGAIAHLKIIDISCPNQLLAALKWIMEGNKGLVYLRVMRSPAKIIYPSNVTFEYQKGYILKNPPESKVILLSSGRGVHEALKAAEILDQTGIKISVVDMPSKDESLFLSLYQSGKKMIVAEQNNGYIYSQLKETLFKAGKSIDPSRIIPINALDKDGNPQFIQSAIYPQLIHHFGLSPEQLAETIKKIIE